VNNDLSRCLVAICKGASGLENTQGSGILLSSYYLLTCAHVVEAVLPRDRCNPQTGPSAEEEIPVIVGATTTQQHLRQAKVVAWRQNQGHGVSESDIALLRLTEPVPFDDLWFYTSSHRVDERVVVGGFGCKEGLWAKARCIQGVGSWVQVDFESHDIDGGCSGGLVTDPQYGKLYGMVVARQDYRDVAYMIPSAELRKMKELVDLLEVDEPVPFIAVLAKNINRSAQLKEINHATQSQPFQCFVVECTPEDMPQCFASKFKIQPHLKQHGLMKFSEDVVNPVVMSNVGLTKDSFMDDLASKVPGGLKQWVTGAQGQQVVYVLSEGRDFIHQLHAVMAALTQLKDASAGAANAGSLVVITPLFINQFNRLKRWKIRRQLNQLIKENKDQSLTLLPPLAALQRDDLRKFVPSLPSKAQQDFKDKFDHVDIEADFVTEYTQVSSQRYEAQIVPFKKVLTRKLKN